MSGQHTPRECPYCGTQMVETGAPIWEEYCPNDACDGHRKAMFAAISKQVRADRAMRNAGPHMLKALQGIMAKLDTGRDAPGHHHTVAGVWDADNDPEIAGKPCEWCAHWALARAAIAAATGGAA